MNTCYNPFSLEGKHMLITGASSGIGKDIAKECSKMGATLIITGRNEDRLSETLVSLEGSGHKMIVADLNESIGRNFLLENIGAIDGLVLAAGIVEMLPVLFATNSKFEKIYKTNLFSPIELLRLIVKRKLYNNGLSVVVIDSIAGTDSIATANGIYGSGKAALKSFMKYFALETAKKGIRVNTVSPGLILTPMHTNGTISEQELKMAVEKVPIKRWGTGKDIAMAAIYLLSSASSYITGADIRIDGGVSI